MSSVPSMTRFYLIAAIVLALTWLVPIPYNSLSFPEAYAHHGGGGTGSGGAGGSGRGNGMNRNAPNDGYGKGGRGIQGMKS